MSSLNLCATDNCEELKNKFEDQESAYDLVLSMRISSNSAYTIIGEYIEQGRTLLKICPKTYSLDHQYTLKRKLSKAQWYQPSYKVLTQDQVAGYAVSHPEQRVIYRWGTVKISP